MPTRIDIESKDTPVGATLMKSGCTVSYLTGDDGDIQAGRATDFFTLANPNPFGSTLRFTDELGGSTYTNNIVIDWSTYDAVAGTVLGVYRNVTSAGNLPSVISTISALSVGGFTGWRCWNVIEAVNFIRWEIADTYGYSYLGGTINAGMGIWTSTIATYSNSAHFINTYYKNITYADYTGGSANGVAVRTFTVTGTTLS